MIKSGKTARLRAELVLASITLVWGGTFIVTKVGLELISPLILVCLRFALAALVLAAIFRKRLLRVTAALVRQGLVLGVFLWLGYALQTLGLRLTTASKSAFITYTFAVFTPVVQVLLLRVRPTRASLIGLGLVMSGLFLYASPGAAGFNAGDALTLASALAYAFYMVLLNRYTTGAYEVLAFLQFLVTALLSLLASPLIETPVFSVTRESLLALVYLGVLGTALALSLQTRFQRDTTPTRAALVFSLEPVFSAFLAWLLLGEGLSPVELGGCGLILLGLFAAEAPALKKMFIRS